MVTWAWLQPGLPQTRVQPRCVGRDCCNPQVSTPRMHWCWGSMYPALPRGQGPWDFTAPVSMLWVCPRAGLSSRASHRVS